MIASFTFFIMPLFFILFIAELVSSYKEEKQLYNRRDTVMNIVIGIGFFVINFFLKGTMFYAFDWIYQFRLNEIPHNLISCIFVFIGADFSFYVYHRVSHEVNWFWAAHVVHHSSEEFNLSVAFRMPWITNLTGHFLFWMWMPLIGFEPITVLVAIQFGIVYQTLLHTRMVSKMHPLIEFVFNTPSHHRVHHSSNLEYLDKNHGGVLIIWDRIFKTFREEEAEPEYGLTSKVDLKSPFNVIFHVWNDMFRNVKKANTLKHKIKYLLNAPGWSHDGSSKTVKQLRQSKSRILVV